MASRAAALTVSATRPTRPACLLTVRGELDSSTYLELRDAVIKAALEEPSAVLVDVNALTTPAESAWSVFTSARWHVSRWPDVPIILVCAGRAVSDALTRNGITRYVPVLPTVDAALQVTDDGPPRRRARTELPAATASLRHARQFTAERLTEWSRGELIPTATVLVDILVHNVLQHTDSTPVVVLEATGSRVTISVQDRSTHPAVRREGRDGAADVSGLAVVAALSLAWGSTPMLGGKAVWAAIGPENLL